MPRPLTYWISLRLVTGNKTHPCRQEGTHTKFALQLDGLYCQVCLGSNACRCGGSGIEWYAKRREMTKKLIFLEETVLTVDELALLLNSP